LQDRRAGASERSQAVRDRDTSVADRGAGAIERSEAGLDRDGALTDRWSAAHDRTDAGLDRDTASADRGAAATDREHASLDSLTGVYRRGAGSLELEREIARARRTGQPLVLAFIDVDGLKAVNDTHGHPAGDQLLIAVAQQLRAHLRSYDLIIRYGGDEFLCVVTGLNLPDVTRRLDFVNGVLAEAPSSGSVTVGLSALQPEDSLDDLVDRADAALYELRHQQALETSPATPGE
jgi:diguanylate cyclase (GGDEF)-like protein